MDNMNGYNDSSYETPVQEAQQTSAQSCFSPEAPQTLKKPKKGWTGGRITALALACAVIGGAMGFGGSLLGNRVSGSDSAAPTAQGSSVVYEGQRPTSVINISHVDTATVKTAAEVYAENVNSTVGIRTSIVTTNFWGYQSTGAAAGSGFIISSDGYILTNYHVVEDSTSNTVSLYDGTEYDAELVGYDESNDIAVLKIDAKDLSPVVLGDSDNMNIGDGVLAIGNPLGELTFSLTTGVVSALDREVTLSSNVTMNLIQTDCAINSGNSGGALFNLYGEVIGITNAKYSYSSSGTTVDNIGFAIPINHVKSIVESIIENGYIAKPYIGVSVSDVSSEAQSYGLPAGASVQSVVENGPAAEAGVQQSDIITAANGTEISGKSDLVNLVGTMTPGDELRLTVYRQGGTIELTVTVGETQKSATANEDAQQQTQSQQQEQQYSQGGQSMFPFGYGYGYGGQG